MCSESVTTVRRATGCFARASRRGLHHVTTNGPVAWLLVAAPLARRRIFERLVTAMRLVDRKVPAGIGFESLAAPGALEAKRSTGVHGCDAFTFSDVVSEDEATRGRLVPRIHHDEVRLDHYHATSTMMRPRSLAHLAVKPGGPSRATTLPDSRPGHVGRKSPRETARCGQWHPWELCWSWSSVSFPGRSVETRSSGSPLSSDLGRSWPDERALRFSVSGVESPWATCPPPWTP